MPPLSTDASFAQDNVAALDRQAAELAEDEKTLDAKIKKKQAELLRSQKRLESLAAVRPAFMDEYEKLEVELADAYEAYVTRYRNLDYLQHELDEVRAAQSHAGLRLALPWRLLQRCCLPRLRRRCSTTSASARRSRRRLARSSACRSASGTRTTRRSGATSTWTTTRGRPSLVTAGACCGWWRLCGEVARACQCFTASVEPPPPQGQAVNCGRWGKPAARGGRWLS